MCQSIFSGQKYLNSKCQLVIPDRYPISHKEDFKNGLSCVNIFPKIDLIRACHKFPVFENDVSWTAFTTDCRLSEPHPTHPDAKATLNKLQKEMCTSELESVWRINNQGQIVKRILLWEFTRSQMYVLPTFVLIQKALYRVHMILMQWRTFVAQVNDFGAVLFSKLNGLVMDLTSF